MNPIDAFRKDLEENKRNEDRAEKYKLKNGDNKLVILTNPIGFSQVFGLGVVYEGAPYGKYGGRKYKCYVLDLNDNRVKIADFSYTTAKKIASLSEGTRTKFDGFPMPYAINLKTVNASTKKIETDVLADADYEPTSDVIEQLQSLSPIQEIIENLKKWSKKQVEENPEFQQKFTDFLAKKADEEKERMENRKKDENIATLPTVDVGEDDDYPENENSGDIPF